MYKGLLSYDEGCGVQSKHAKRATRVFATKEEAIEYGENVAKNKQVKLEIYKQGGSLQKTVDHESS